MPRRTLLYCIFLLLISGAIYLPFLSRYPISGDEQIYAMCVDNLRGGNSSWLYPSAYQGEPYFQKPPLYMWLSASTSRFFSPDNPAQYRIWSAIFGVLVIVSTCALGARLYNPEVGLVAAFLLCVNDNFVRNHGVETGTFDTGLTLACLLCWTIYYSWAKGKLGSVGWATIGVIAGLATLLKPMFGLLPIGLLALHAIFFLKNRPFRQRIIGPLLAIVIAVLCSAWWYLFQYHHFGQRYIDIAWRQNIVARVQHGIDPRNVQPFFYYPLRISLSSITFVLAIPALIYLIARMIRGQRPEVRGQPFSGNDGFILFVAIAWVVLFSISASKYLHYVYPVMPLIAIAMGVMLVEIGERLRGNLPISEGPGSGSHLPPLPPGEGRGEGGFSSDLAARKSSGSSALTPTLSQKERGQNTLSLSTGRGGGLIAIGTFCVVPILVTLCGIQLGLGMAAEARRFYDPWRLYQQFKPAINSGKISLIEFGLPKATSQWQDPRGADLEEEDVFYLSKMPATRIENSAELMKAIEKPSIVLMPRAVQLAEANLPGVYSLFDGHTRRIAIRTFHLDELLDPKKGSEWFDYTIVREGLSLKVIAKIKAPIVAGAILSVIARGDCDDATAIVAGQSDLPRVHHVAGKCVMSLDLPPRQIPLDREMTIQIISHAKNIEEVSLRFEPHP